MDYRGQSSSAQFSPPSVERELLKAYSGFVVPPDLNAPKTLGTGNWGAGAFLGDASLKALIQWAAASEAGLADIHYFPFDNEELHYDLPRISASLVAKGTTVGQLCRWLLSGRASNPVLRQLGEEFGLGLNGMGAKSKASR